MARFKKSEWNGTVTQAILKEMLGDFYNEFNLHYTGGWTETAVWRFLQVHHWLYKEANPKPQHHKTIVSILTEMLV